jgi:CRP/FNR family cyclic AMP-dependent transcriptional regulator
VGIRGVRSRSAPRTGGASASHENIARSNAIFARQGVPAQSRGQQWPALRDLSSIAALPSSSYRYLLDLDDDLASELDLRMRLVARQVVTAVVFAAPVGECDLAPCFAEVGHGPGVLIVDGVLSVDVRVGDRTATEIVGDGDVIQPFTARADDLLDRDSTWHALVPARLALLDDAFAERIKPWPQLSRALLSRACSRAADLDVQRAITSQPRLEVRLTLLLWHLAGRWGRVEPGGIRIALPLTHRLLGRLVGAERPSVSHALARLAQSGLVTSRDGALHLHGTADEHLAAFAGGPASRRDDGTLAAGAGLGA